MANESDKITPAEAVGKQSKVKAANVEIETITTGLQAPTGVVLRSQTVARNPDGSVSLSESSVFVPDAKLVEGENGKTLVGLHN